MKLTEGKVGALAYNIYVDGEPVETVTEDDALEYLHGYENIVEGLESALEGLSAGDTFDVTVEPARAYGEYDEEMVETIPTEDFEFEEHGIEPEVGLEVEMMDEEGNIFEAVIVGFEDGAVQVDMNHPLAGKSIRYEGRVLEVRDASEEELNWGLPESLLDEYFDEDDWDEEGDEGEE